MHQAPLILENIILSPAFPKYIRVTDNLGQKVLRIQHFLPTGVTGINFGTTVTPPPLPPLPDKSCSVRFTGVDINFLSWLLFRQQSLTIQLPEEEYQLLKTFGTNKLNTAISAKQVPFYKLPIIFKFKVIFKCICTCIIISCNDISSHVQTN